MRKIALVWTGIAVMCAAGCGAPEPAQTSPQQLITCEFVKVYTKWGSSKTVVFIADNAGASETRLIDCAVKTIKPQTNYVYFFTDKAKAKAWAPTDFGPGPAMEGCIGRAYQDKPGGPIIYTPKDGW